MAQDKKSFLLYCDLIFTVIQMPDDKAGVLFKHILAYVNDQSPESDDLIVQLCFEPIKQQLKRDLLKYEDKIKGRSEAGKLGVAARRAKKKEQELAIAKIEQANLTSVERVVKETPVATSGSEANPLAAAIPEMARYVGNSC